MDTIWTIAKWALMTGFVLGNGVVILCVIKGIKSGRQRKKRGYDWQKPDWRTFPDHEFSEHNGQRF